MMVDIKIIMTGLFCLTALEIVAIMNGINGTILKIVVAIIALTIGITIPNPIGGK